MVVVSWRQLAPVFLIIASAMYLGVQVTCPMGSVQKRIVPIRSDADVQGAADDCFHVFIDAGSNLGVHGRFLFEPEKYRRATVAKQKFDKEFGNVTERRQNTCVFAFEPNPMHKTHQSFTESAYATMGWKYFYIPMGVGRQNQTINFYKNSNWGHGSKNEEWGFSTIQHDRDSVPISVPVLDFAEWLARVVKRRLPPSKAAWGKPKVVMKMDVEGMEIQLVPHLLTQGVLCKIDAVFGEVHPYGPYNLQNGVIIGKGHEEPRTWIENINRVLLADGCQSTFELLDDETYKHDGMPYPSPPN